MEIKINISRDNIQRYKDYVAEMGMHQYDKDMTEYCKAERGARDMQFMFGQLVAREMLEQEQAMFRRERMKLGLNIPV